MSLEKTVRMLNFIVRNTACYKAMKVRLAREVVRAKLDTKPRREEISLKVKLSCLLCHVWCNMC